MDTIEEEEIVKKDFCSREKNLLSEEIFLPFRVDPICEGALNTGKNTRNHSCLPSTE